MPCRSRRRWCVWRRLNASTTPGPRLGVGPTLQDGKSVVKIHIERPLCGHRALKWWERPRRVWHESGAWLPTTLLALPLGVTGAQKKPGPRPSWASCATSAGERGCLAGRVSGPGFPQLGCGVGVFPGPRSLCLNCHQQDCELKTFPIIAQG